MLEKLLFHVSALLQVYLALRRDRGKDVVKNEECGTTASITFRGMWKERRKKMETEEKQWHAVRETHIES